MRALLPTGLLLLVLLAMTASSGSIVTATTPPSGFLDNPTFVTGLTSPTAMAFAPDGRLFIAEQAGVLRVVKQGALLKTPFLTLTVDSLHERGLIGIAFDTAFASTPYVYLHYTVLTPAPHNRISRVLADGDVMLPKSEEVLLELEDLTGTIHNGGAIHFGADGKLYIAVGDSGTGTNAQSMTSRFGKMLRLNKDGTIPDDNPFTKTATGIYRAIWALGLRNPFTFAFQPGTNNFYINDVGASAWEEINQGVAGANYGWPATEGETTNPAFRSPLFAYDHHAGCAISGGAFYNPAATQFPPSYVGKYFYADWCGNYIRLYDPATDTSSNFATGLSGPVDLKLGPDGGLYYLNQGNGTVGRILHDSVDTDGDGYTDDAELAIKQDPNVPCATMRADTDGDGTVTIVDLASVAGQFLKAVPPGNPRYNQNADATINVIDLSLVAGQFLRAVATCAN